MNSCGDWLTLALKGTVRTEDGGFDLTAKQENHGTRPEEGRKKNEDGVTHYLERNIVIIWGGNIVSIFMS